MDLILVFPTFYLSVYLNFNRSGAAGNLIWFFSSPPNRLHSFGNVKYSPGKICPPYQKLKTEIGKSCCCSLTSASVATLRLPQHHFRLSRFISLFVNSLPRSHFRFRRPTSDSSESLPFQLACFRFLSFPITIPPPYTRFLRITSISAGSLPLRKFPYRFCCLTSNPS
jgi:hypothetical protein